MVLKIKHGTNFLVFGMLRKTDIKRSAFSHAFSFFFFALVSFSVQCLFGSIPSCLISLSCSICLRRLKWERKWEMHVCFQLDGKIQEKSFGLSCSLWAVESPPTPSTLLAHHHQISVSPVLYSKEVAYGHQLLGSASTSEEMSPSQFHFSLS